MTNILLVEDEKGIASIVESYLKNEGFQVYLAYTGKEALEKYYKHNIDLIILDRMLPILSGDEIISEIRRKDYQTPIIMLTALAEEEEAIDGFKLGADDYVTKPFSPRELVERVKAILRRVNNNSNFKNNNNIVLFNGDLNLNLDNHNLLVKDEDIELTNNEFQILRALMGSPKKIFTREEIINLAFGEDYDSYDRAIDTHIKNIRQKIEENPKKPRYIKTVYGLGYKCGEDH